MARVILFNPPGPQRKAFTREGRCTQEAGIWATQWPPLSLATTAALLEQDGHSVQVFDFPALGGSESMLREIMAREQPDFAFWATGTPSLDFDLHMADLVRRISPRTRTGVMGTHVTVDPECALEAAPVDVVVRREPELTIARLCRAGSAGHMEAIRGISFKDRHSGAFHHNPDAPFLAPEHIPSPAWHLIDTDRYRLPLKGSPFLIVAPVRGCPYSCSFCTAPIYYGRKLRKRPITLVADEMQRNAARFGLKDFFIWADTFTADRDYVRQFCRELLGRRLRFSWTCNSRVDTVDRDTLRLMRDAGLWMISFGLESGSREILKATGKAITPGQSAAAVSAAHELGIAVAGHFILGLPGETENTMRQTLKLALDLPLDIAQFYAAAPFPGTALYDEALCNRWIEPGAPLGQGRATLNLPGLCPSSVDAFRRFAYKRFYMRPRTAARLARLLEPQAIRRCIAGSLHFFEWIRS